MTNANNTSVTERREALRRERLNDPDAAERTAELHESAARVERGLCGTLSVITGESVEKLHELGF